MTDAKREKQKQRLVNLGLMEEQDNILDFFAANYFSKMIGNWGQWKQGWVHFTEERLIITTALSDDNIVIPYKNISALNKCNQIFMPMGIAISYNKLETNEPTTDKISLTKREKWMSLMAEKAGIPLS